MSHLGKIEDYLQLLSEFEEEEAFENLLHSEFIQTEFPNLLNKAGQTSHLGDIFVRMKRGRQLLETQSYEIQSSLEKQNKAYVEALWTGVMAVDAGPFKKGQKLSAHFCMAFEFKGDKIFRQRNYDCFDSL